MVFVLDLTLTSRVFGPVLGIKLTTISYLAIRWHYGTHNYHTSDIHVDMLVLPAL